MWDKIFDHIFSIDSEYPCKGCVVVSCCTNLCEKIEFDDELLILRLQKEYCCPDCGGEFELYHEDGHVDVRCLTCFHQFKVYKNRKEEIICVSRCL